MNREVHVRFCEGVGVKFPRATRPFIHTFPLENSLQDVGGESQRANCRLKYVELNRFAVAFWGSI